MLRELSAIAAAAGVVAVWLETGAMGDSNGLPSLLESQARYGPIQSITYEFGSKLMTGYFVEQSGACVVTLMVIEKTDPEEPLGLTPMRVRLALAQGQIAGLDSEEGPSLNFTCETGATTLLVDFGERDRLVALQNAALRENIARRR
jgi:hypothetical protein